MQEIRKWARNECSVFVVLLSCLLCLPPAFAIEAVLPVDEVSQQPAVQVKDNQDQKNAENLNAPLMGINSMDAFLQDGGLALPESEPDVLNFLKSTDPDYHPPQNLHDAEYSGKLDLDTNGNLILMDPYSAACQPQTGARISAYGQTLLKEQLNDKGMSLETFLGSSVSVKGKASREADGKDSFVVINQFNSTILERTISANTFQVSASDLNAEIALDLNQIAANDAVRIYYAESNQPGLDRSLWTHSSLICGDGNCHADLSDLAPGTKYNYFFKVTTYDGGLVVESNELSFQTTDPRTIALSAPDIQTDKESALIQIQIGGLQPGDKVKLSYRKNSGNLPAVLMDMSCDAGGLCKAALDHLFPGTNYQISILVYDTDEKIMEQLSASLTTRVSAISLGKPIVSADMTDANIKMKVDGLQEGDQIVLNYQSRPQDQLVEIPMICPGLVYAESIPLTSVVCETGLRDLKANSIYSYSMTVYDKDHHAVKNTELSKQSFQTTTGYLDARRDEILEVKNEPVNSDQLKHETVSGLFDKLGSYYMILDETASGCSSVFKTVFTDAAVILPVSQTLGEMGRELGRYYGKHIQVDMDYVLNPDGSKRIIAIRKFDGIEIPAFVPPVQVFDINGSFDFRIAAGHGKDSTYPLVISREDYEVVAFYKSCPDTVCLYQDTSLSSYAEIALTCEYGNANNELAAHCRADNPPASSASLYSFYGIRNKHTGELFAPKLFSNGAIIPSMLPPQSVTFGEPIEDIQSKVGSISVVVDGIGLQGEDRISLSYSLRDAIHVYGHPISAEIPMSCEAKLASDGTRYSDCTARFAYLSELGGFYDYEIKFDHQTVKQGDFSTPAFTSTTPPPLNEIQATGGLLHVRVNGTAGDNLYLYYEMKIDNQNDLFVNATSAPVRMNCTAKTETDGTIYNDCTAHLLDLRGNALYIYSAKALDSTGKVINEAAKGEFLTSFNPFGTGSYPVDGVFPTGMPKGSATINAGKDQAGVSIAMTNYKANQLTFVYWERGVVGPEITQAVSCSKSSFDAYYGVDFGTRTCVGEVKHLKADTIYDYYISIQDGTETLGLGSFKTQSSDLIGEKITFSNVQIIPDETSIQVGVNTVNMLPTDKMRIELRGDGLPGNWKNVEMSCNANQCNAAVGNLSASTNYAYRISIVAGTGEILKSTSGSFNTVPLRVIVFNQPQLEVSNGDSTVVQVNSSQIKPGPSGDQVMLFYHELGSDEMSKTPAVCADGVCRANMAGMQSGKSYEYYFVAFDNKGKQIGQSEGAVLTAKPKRDITLSPLVYGSNIQEISPGSFKLMFVIQGLRPSDRVKLVYGPSAYPDYFSPEPVRQQYVSCVPVSGLAGYSGCTGYVSNLVSFIPYSLHIVVEDKTGEAVMKSQEIGLINNFPNHPPKWKDEFDPDTFSFQDMGAVETAEGSATIKVKLANHNVLQDVFILLKESNNPADPGKEYAITGCRPEDAMFPSNTVAVCETKITGLKPSTSYTYQIQAYNYIPYAPGTLYDPKLGRTTLIRSSSPNTFTTKGTPFGLSRREAHVLPAAANSSIITFYIDNFYATDSVRIQYRDVGTNGTWNMTTATCMPGLGRTGICQADFGHYRSDGLNMVHRKSGETLEYKITVNGIADYVVNDTSAALFAYYDPLFLTPEIIINKGRYPNGDGRGIWV